MSDAVYEKLQDLIENMDKIQEQLRPWTQEANIFNILKISNQEIRHSNFLAYLFNPSASHGFKDAFFKEFLIKFHKTNKHFFQQELEINVFDLILGDFDDVFVYRELHNIDLLLVSEKNKLVVCIENKIEASESPHQLKKYENYVVNHYPDYDKLFIFLNTDGTAPSRGSWGTITYTEVIEILNKIIADYELISKVEILIIDYIKMIRRNILMDDELRKICRRIYIEYQEALDLIYEVKPDINSTMHEIILEVLTELKEENKIIFEEQYSSKTMLRFQIEELDKVFPQFPDGINSGWKDQKSYFVEVGNKSDSLRVSVAFNSGNSDSIRRDVSKKLSLINQRKKNTNWTWWTVGSSHLFPNSKDYLDNLLNHINENGHEQVTFEVKESIEGHIERIKKLFAPLIEENKS
ncbi:PD-(D/E)XK nuclease family protein [Alkalibacterium iburiense]|uniref:PD-(D/E)XK nuclease family protein n=1 Tax=Alkalibacterium iburiense TaxID=290589 RepID=A0ABN0XRL2_9LACT